jgi:hypothetical protein
MSKDHAQVITQLLAEIGPRWNRIELILRVEERHWRVRLEDGACWRSRTNRTALVASARLSRGDESNRLAIYTAMLGLNALASETGGLRLGLTDSDEIELVLAVADSLDSVDGLQLMLEPAGLTDQWKAFVEKPSGTAPGLPANASLV